MDPSENDRTPNVGMTEKGNRFFEPGRFHGHTGKGDQVRLKLPGVSQEGRGLAHGQLNGMATVFQTTGKSHGAEQLEPDILDEQNTCHFLLPGFESPINTPHFAEGLKDTLDTHGIRTAKLGGVVLNGDFFYGKTAKMRTQDQFHVCEVAA